MPGQAVECGVGKGPKIESELFGIQSVVYLGPVSPTLCGLKKLSQS